MYGLKNVRSRRDDALTRVGWEQLESLLAVYYRGQGYEVEHCGTGGTRARFDGGIDLKLRKDDQYILIQCKHWNAKQVPHNAVHELLGIMVNQSATGAILVTSGEFSKAAIEAATRQGHVQLIDGDELRVMLGPIEEVRGTSSDFIDDSRPIVAHVGERLLRATEDRIRGSRSDGRNNGSLARTAFSLFLLKTVLPLLFMISAMLLGWSMLKHAILGLQPVAPIRVQAEQQPAPTAIRAVTDMPASSKTSRAMIAPSKPMSNSERGDQKRREAEELRHFNENTPEM